MVLRKANKWEKKPQNHLFIKIYNLVKTKKKKKERKRTAQWKPVVFESPAPPSFTLPVQTSAARQGLLSRRHQSEGCLPREVVELPATCCWSCILGECSPETGVPPSTQTPFMRRRLYLGCYITENTFGPNRPCLGLSSGGPTLGEANWKSQRRLWSSHWQLGSTVGIPERMSLSPPPAPETPSQKFCLKGKPDNIRSS